MTRPFRFGLRLSDDPDRVALVDMVRRAEDAGFAVLCGVDHIGTPLGVIPLLATAAEMSSLRVSPMVIANDYRHPVLLAKDFATLDALSGGRVELGIGTGWVKAQYDSAGIPYDAPGIRVDRLTEAIQVIKGCWSGEPFTFTGAQYRVDLTGHPTPTQRPHPPLLIAGSGRRMLRLAGREADIVGFTVTVGRTGYDTFMRGLATSAERIEEQLAWLREGAGERYDDLELSVMIHGHLTNDAAVDRLASEEGVPAELIRRSPHLLAGGTAEMAEALLSLRERTGISYVVFRYPDFEAAAPVVAQLAGS